VKKMAISKLKYLFLYLYEASEKMEEKAKEFAETRKTRMDEFRKERMEAARGAMQKFEEKKGEASEKIKEQVRSVIKELGLATKDEIQDLKAAIRELSKKLEGPKEGSKK
jgi:polyhydroxyalkanoate synthesis regulator phasin